MREMLKGMDVGKRLLLGLCLMIELVLMAAALWPTVWVVLRWAPWARTTWHWVLLILAAVLVFNYGYLIALLVLRLVIPRPKEGYYPIGEDRRVPRQAVTFMFNLLLVKARFDPPWAAMFSSVLVNVFPLALLYRRFFGPRTWSLTMGDTIYCLDPCLVEVGRNVQLGFHCVLIAHLFDNRGLLIRKVVIEDNAVVGGESTLMPGVRVGHHAVVASRSLVPADTVIGPYEYWAGTPARKIKSLAPAEPAAEQAESSGSAPGASGF